MTNTFIIKIKWDILDITIFISHIQMSFKLMDSVNQHCPKCFTIYKSEHCAPCNRFGSGCGGANAVSEWVHHSPLAINYEILFSWVKVTLKKVHIIWVSKSLIN